MWSDPYTITTWESRCGDFLIENDNAEPTRYVVRKWGIDPPAHVNGQEIKQQMGWQPVTICANLEEAKKVCEELGAK